MKRTRSIACFLVALLGCGALALAQVLAGVPGSLPDDSPLLSLLLQRRQEFALSADQLRRLEGLRIELQKDALWKGSAIQIAELELSELQGSGPIDSATLEVKLRQIEVARTQLRLAAITATERARAMLSPGQRTKLELLEKASSPPSGLGSALDFAVRQQIQTAIREQLKDQKVVEVETTQAIVNRLTDLGKLLLVIGGVPLAILSFFGIKKLSSLSALLRLARNEITQAHHQVEAIRTQANGLTDEYEKIKQSADDLAVRYQNIQAEADRALQEISTAKQSVADEGQRATLEIRTTATAFRAQSVSPSDSDVVTIPVVVHVVYRTDVENISDAQIQSQIDVLNQDFRARNPDISMVPPPFREFIGDARIEFVLATRDPFGNPTTAITRTATTHHAFKADDSVKSSATDGVGPWDTERYLNIWVCTLSEGLLRSSQLPGGPKNTDGVVIHHAAFGTTGTATEPFHKGRTATGGIAQYLNLRHIWGDGDCTDSDFVADTPPQKGPNFGKPTFPHISCNNGPHGDMFMNFMDYVDDDAMYMFTKGQVLRMHETLKGPRRKLGRS